jgi:hypothetical protein
MLGAMALAACAAPPPGLPKAPVPAGSAIVVKAVPVPLDPGNPARERLGDLTYAGGVALTSDQTSRLHGLSDLDVQADGRLVAVGDEGDLFRGQVVLDAAGRLAGVTDGRISALMGVDGRPLSGKNEADSEGLALMPSGDLLISFERHDRILLYPAAGGPPHPVPSPATRFPFNEGMEALAPDPDRGPHAFITGGETSGLTWLCNIHAPCVDGPKVSLPTGFGLVAARRLPAGRTAWLLRAFNPVTKSVIELRITGPDGKVVDQQALRGPLTVDNFEGLSAVPQPDGRIRFYMISDDNFSASQRTLLMAFDWTPPKDR